jgi:hypothetical protein
MVLLLGPKTRSFLRLVVMPEYIFSGVKDITKMAGMMSAGRFAALFRFGGVSTGVAIDHGHLPAPERIEASFLEFTVAYARFCAERSDPGVFFDKSYRDNRPQ